MKAETKAAIVKGLQDAFGQAFWGAKWADDRLVMQHHPSLDLDPSEIQYVVQLAGGPLPRRVSPMVNRLVLTF